MVFHRLELKIIHTSNNQSIFAWGRDKTLLCTGSILASDLSCFKGCSHLELLDYKKFIKSLDECFPGKELPSIREDHFGVFPIMNGGIQIWMPLCHYHDPDTIFKAYLPCRDQGRPVVTIDLAFWDFNYYRHSLTVDEFPARGSLEFRQIFLRYQDAPNHNMRFEIDDSAITGNGFICCDTYPMEFVGNTLTVSATSPLCVKSYSESQGNGHFSVTFGQYFGWDWVHLISSPAWRFSWLGLQDLLIRGPEYAQSMSECLLELIPIVVSRFTMVVSLDQLAL